MPSSYLHPCENGFKWTGATILPTVSRADRLQGYYTPRQVQPHQTDSTPLYIILGLDLRSYEHPA